MKTYKEFNESTSALNESQNKFKPGQRIKPARRFPGAHDEYEFVRYRQPKSLTTHDGSSMQQDCVIKDLKDGIKIVSDSSEWQAA
ncbi:hypothetical protein VPHD481_0017 [Vibrio phage D481]